MKIKIKHLLMMLLCISVSSMMLVSCSDDDESVMGPVAINSCQYTATEVTPIWTLVPNDNCEGYVITLYKGTRANVGDMVEEKKLDYRTCKCTFSGLTPNTQYVISTQAIPSAKSGFSSAQIYWKEFTTSAQ